jgi:cell division protein FtsB
MNTSEDRLLEIIAQLTKKIEAQKAEVAMLESEKKKLFDHLVEDHAYSATCLEIVVQ